MPSTYIRQRVEIRHPVDEPEALFLFDNGARIAKLKLVDVGENAHIFSPKTRRGMLGLTGLVRGPVFQTGGRLMQALMAFHNLKRMPFDKNIRTAAVLDAEPAREFAASLDFINQRGGILVLIGDPGVGKDNRAA